MVAPPAERGVVWCRTGSEPWTPNPELGLSLLTGRLASLDGPITRLSELLGECCSPIPAKHNDSTAHHLCHTR